MKALLIIDMQKGFTTANHTGTINNCIRQVKKAKKSNMPIFLLEYVGFNRTVKPIMDAIRGYSKKFVIKKQDDDGSYPLMNFILDNSLNIDSFIVCGVNIGACIESTVYSLSREYDINVTVIKNACNDRFSSKIESFRNYKYTFNSRNVSVI